MVICLSRQWQSSSSKSNNRWKTPRVMCNPGGQTYCEYIHVHAHVYDYRCNTFDRGILKSVEPMTLLNNFAFLRFPLASFTNEECFCANVSNVRKLTFLLALGIFKSSDFMSHQRQQ